MAEVGYIFPEDAAKQVVDVGNAIKATDDKLLKYTEDASKLIALLKQQNISFEQLQKVQKEAVDTTNKLDSVGKTLLQSEEKLKQVTDKRTESILKNRLETQKATKDIQLKIRVQQAEKGSIEQLSAVNAILEKRLKSVNLTTEEGRKKADLLRSAIDKNNVKIKENSSALSAQRINIGNYKSALEGLPGPLGNAARGAMTLGKQLWALVTNPIVATVAAIVAVFAGLVSVFKSTDKGGTLLSALWKSMGAILDVLKRRVVVLIDAFSALFSGNFREAGEKFKETVTGIGEELKNTTKAAWDYIYAQDALNDRMTAFISENARAKNEIEKLLQLSKDQTKSDKERMNALESALNLQSNLSKKKVEFAELEYQNEIKLAASKAQINQKELDDFIRMNEAEQTEARKNNKSLAEAWNLLGDEKIKSLEDFYAKSVDADTEYYSSTKRTVSQLSALQVELSNERKKEVEKRNKFDEAWLDYQEKLYTEELKIWAEEINQRYELNLKKIELEKSVNDTIAQIREDARKKEEEKANEESDKILERIKKINEDEKKQKEETNKQIFDGGVTLANTLFDLKSSQLQREFEMAEGNEQKQKEISAKIAKTERNKALFDIGLNTAVGIMKAIAQTGLPAAIPFVVLTAAIGAAQALAVSKIPKFAKGTDYAPNEFIAGEKGREIVKTKSGDVVMADKATHFKGNRFKGATVYTNRETEQIISESGRGNNFTFDTRELRDEMRAVKDAIVKKPIAITDNSGRVIGKQSNNYRETYLNRMQNGR